MNATVLAIWVTVSAWARFLGSHIRKEEWDLFPLFVRSGIRSAIYLLWHRSDAQDEDLRRLKEDAGFTRLVLRLGWHAPEFGPPPPPAEYIELFRAKVRRARAVGYQWLAVLPFNEPNLELVREIKRPDGTLAFEVLMSRAAFLAWGRELIRLWRADPELRDIPLVGIPVAPYCDEPTDPRHSMGWWNDCLRELNELSDFAGVMLYPASEQEMEGTWSLSWWLAQTSKFLCIVEYGARTGTPAAVRAALLPRLAAQIHTCRRLVFGASFAPWTEGEEHREHWWTPTWVSQMIATASGEAPQPPAPSPLPPSPVAATLSPEHGGPMAVHNRAVWDEWVRDGGIRKNFEKHGYALGLASITPAALRLLADEAVAGSEQLRTALRRYPFP